MKFEVTYPPGATPLAPDEAAGLIPDYITTRGELNQLEQENIQDAILWIRRRKAIALNTVGFVYELHKQMFGQVWKWAGSARRSGKNIGVDWAQIPTHVGQLLGDVRYWIENKTFPVDEIAARFHHRLVQIHIFPNGNGRHARIMADLLLQLNGHEPFTWGARVSQAPLEVEGVRRKEYIAALRSADKGEYGPLLALVRS